MKERFNINNIRVFPRVSATGGDKNFPVPSLWGGDIWGGQAFIGGDNLGGGQLGGGQLGGESFTRGGHLKVWKPKLPERNEE